MAAKMRTVETNIVASITIRVPADMTDAEVIAQLSEYSFDINALANIDVESGPKPRFTQIRFGSIQPDDLMSDPQ